MMRRAALGASQVAGQSAAVVLAAAPRKEGLFTSYQVGGVSEACTLCRRGKCTSNKRVLERAGFSSSLPGTPMRQHQGFHTAAAARGKPKVVVSEVLPPGWKWGPNQKANSREYKCTRQEYTKTVGVLRNKWSSLVLMHERKV